MSRAPLLNVQLTNRNWHNTKILVADTSVSATLHLTWNPKDKAQRWETQIQNQMKLTKHNNLQENKKLLGPPHNIMKWILFGFGHKVGNFVEEKARRSYNKWQLSIFGFLDNGVVVSVPNFHGKVHRSQTYRVTIICNTHKTKKK